MEKKPMIRELTAEGRFESGLDALVAGKRFAFLAIVGDRHAARLGAAVENEPGYYPVPEHWAHADSMLELQKHADALNARMGLSTKAAGKLVATTFAASRANLPQPDTAPPPRLATRKAAISRRNETLERILTNPPPCGAVIRFTDGKLRPRPPAERGMDAWLTNNGTGVLVSVRKSSGVIMLRMESRNPSGGDDYYRTFDMASALAFNVETVPVPGELIEVGLLPWRLRKDALRDRATLPASRST